MLPTDHPLRLELAAEVHARPPEPLDTPSRATYVALMVAPEDRAREHAHLVQLCEHHGVTPPAAKATRFSAQLGGLRLKWERHGEFSGITVFAAGVSAHPFSEPVVAMLPAGWLAGLPGTTVVAAHAKLIAESSAPAAPGALAALFEGNIVVGSDIGEGAGVVYTDFRVHADGFSRFLVVDRSFTRRQSGRMLQRLFEIEAYRMMALLALPIARQQSPQILSIEQELSTLTDRIAVEDGNDEALLHDLTRLAAQIERCLSASQFRIGACRAYHELVTTRIAELRETRLPGIQTIEEFMARRLTPAVATCNMVSTRLHDLSERVSQASALLSTRVDITRERQNQALLASMDRRALLQLRLQQTVEGLSVAAIVYYAAGLVGYLTKAGIAIGLPLQHDLAVGIAIPIVAVLAILGVRRVRRSLHSADREL
jgi:uncharacterized membrane-anchored protein